MSFGYVKASDRGVAGDGALQVRLSPEVKAWKRRVKRLRKRDTEAGILNTLHLACLGYYRPESDNVYRCPCGDVLEESADAQAHGLAELGVPVWEKKVTRRD